MEIETGVNVQEVAEPDGAEVQEVAEPDVSEAVVETEQEPAPPARDKERDSWFAEQRRKLDSERKEMESKFQNQIEAERQRIAELEAKTKTYEVNDRNARLKEVAEQNGLDYDELVAEADRQDALEAEKMKTAEELQREKTEKEQIAEEKRKLEDDLRILKMTMEDRDELLKFDPNINLEDLGEDFYKLRSILGKSPLEAYKMSQANKPETITAEPPGKLNSVQPENEFFTEAEWNAMTDEQQDKLINDPATWPKVKRSHDKWIET